MDVKCMYADGEGASSQTSCLVAQQGGQVGELGVNVTDMVLTAEGKQFVEKMSVFDKGEGGLDGFGQQGGYDALEFCG